MSVLPWPGVTAWPAPRPRAVRTDRSSTIGLRSTDWKIAGSSPPTPPGTAPTTPIPAAAGAAGGAVGAGVASAATAVPRRTGPGRHAHADARHASPVVVDF